MQSNEKIIGKVIEIGKYLPQGSKKRIAKNAGISQQTVITFFRTGKVKEETAVKILVAAQPFFIAAQKLKKAKEELIEAMSIV
jgi:hypothetical protein